MVLLWRLPIKMALGHAPMPATAAAVSRVMLGRWRWAAMGFADNPSHVRRAPVDHDLGITLPRAHVGPFNAVVALVGQDDFTQEALGLTWRCSTAKRMTMCFPTEIVRAAPAPPAGRLAAAIDFAC